MQGRMRWKDVQEWSVDKNAKELFVVYLMIKQKPPQPE